MKVLDINEYDFYLKTTPKELKNNFWRSPYSPYSYYDTESEMRIFFPIYKDEEKRPVIFCEMVWYGENEPLRICVYTNSNYIYPTFYREKYDSSSYIKELHKNILKQINKFNAEAHKKQENAVKTKKGSKK